MLTGFCHSNISSPTLFPSDFLSASAAHVSFSPCGLRKGLTYFTSPAFLAIASTAWYSSRISVTSFSGET